MDVRKEMKKVKGEEEMYENIGRFRVTKRIESAYAPIEVEIFMYKVKRGDGGMRG